MPNVSTFGFASDDDGGGSVSVPSLTVTLCTKKSKQTQPASKRD